MATPAKKTVMAMLLWPLLLWIGAALLFSVNLDRQVEFDELYHILAARGWVEGGTLRIADGLYERVGLYSKGIGLLFTYFGESLEIARLPSLIAVSATVPLLFCWLQRFANTRSAWLAALLLASSPFIIDLAQYTRFYGLQILSFLAGSLALFMAVEVSEQNLRKSLGWFFLSILLLATASYLQIASLIGIAGLGLWFFMLVIRPRVGWLLSLTLILAGLIGLMAILLGTVFGAKIWQLYATAPLWAEASASQPWFYHFWFNLFYPSLWPLMPLLSLIALAAFPKPAWICLSIFTTAFLLHSFAAFKDVRYIAYALPFLFTLQALGLVRLFDLLISPLRSLIDQLLVQLGWQRRATLLRPLLAILCITFLLLANTAFIRSATLLADIRMPPQPPLPNWERAKPILEPWLDKADVILTSSELEHLYFLGDYNILISRSRLSELHGEIIDGRTGKPVIGDLETFSQIVACHQRGIVISPSARWRRGHMIPAELADLISGSLTPLPLPAGANLLAFTWDQPTTGQNCPPP